jgi:uncharacterized membrane protein HdeD (DUF308 family)
MLIEGFLLGVIVAASLTAGAFFIRFWRQTSDQLFMLFGAAFIIEGLNRIVFLFLADPDEGHPAVFGVRLFAYLLILAAIIRKTRASPARTR